jgi:hypothetical protein
MEVVVLESKAFHALIEVVVKQLQNQFGSDEEWLDTEGAMQYLKITSKTTLAKLRESDEIRYSQPMKKHILYYKPSLKEYLDKYSNVPE